MYAHTKFTAGQLPFQLAAKAGAKGYIPADGDAQSFVKVMKIAETCKKLALMWSVKVQDLMAAFVWGKGESMAGWHWLTTSRRILRAIWRLALSRV